MCRIQMSLTDTLWYITMLLTCQRTWFSSHCLFQFTLFAFLISKWIPHGQMINYTIIHCGAFFFLLVFGVEHNIKKPFGIWDDILNESHMFTPFGLRLYYHFQFLKIEGTLVFRVHKISPRASLQIWRHKPWKSLICWSGEPSGNWAGHL